MNISVLKRLQNYPCLPILLGISVFLLLTGGDILRPTNTNWLRIGDAATHLVGWEFFRNTPLLQWPLGANPDYGLALGSSVIFSDSIPLLAFLAKPFSPLLPDQFQYTGIWLLLCFLLQSLLAWKLMSGLTRDRLFLATGTLFFLTAPPFILRIPGHFSLAGQWLILAGLCLYFSVRYSIFRWVLLLLTSALVMPYLLVMTGLILIADLIQRYWKKQLSAGKASAGLLLSGTSVILVMWAAGYFMLGSGVEDSGFGFYRMNLLSPLDPDGSWSRLLRDQRGGPGDYEGFNYLGLGMMGMGFAAAVHLPTALKFMDRARIIPLLVMSLALTLYAVSSHVAVGGHELLSYELPAVARHFTGAFRSSGRFFWPVYYLLFLAVFYLVFTRFRHREAVTICLLALILQIADPVNAWIETRNLFINSPGWSSPMRSPEWDELGTRYRKILLVPPVNASPLWLPLSDFARRHRMGTNAGYFSRVNPDRVRKESERLAESIRNRVLDSDTLYVFEDDFLWETASRDAAGSGRAIILDGFRIMLPPPSPVRPRLQSP